MQATLYNRYENRETGKVEWRRTVLSGERARGKPAVYWQESKRENVLQSGLATADAVLVMVWFTVDAEGRQYLPPNAYAALSPAEVGQHWTLTAGHDRIFKGVVDFPSPVDNGTAAHDGVITVSSVDTWVDCSPAMQHWEVGGK